MSKRMGYQGLAYYGVAGVRGATQLTGSRDIGFSIEVEKGDTTTRGSGAQPPVKTEQVTMISVNITIQFPNESTDTSLEAMRVAAATGAEIALRLQDHSAGKGFDGDVTLSVSNPYPLNGEQVIDFTATPSVIRGVYI